MNEPNPSDSTQTHSPTPEQNILTGTFQPQEGGVTRTRASQLQIPVSPISFPIAGYEMIREIARGGMGVVVEAREVLLNRQVAIKVLLPDAPADRFILESKVTAQLPHPNIPPVYTLGTLSDKSPYLVMKLIRGQTLSDELKARKDTKENLSHWIGVFEQICYAVGFAHSNQIIHRDLKPANIMVGQFAEVQVMDWGLAKDLKSQDPDLTFEDRFGLDGEDLTVTGAVMGTPTYMAPEQARGESVTPQADVFALGGILAAILTGKGAFTGKTTQEIIKLAANGDVSDVLQRLRECEADPELVSIASQCLAPLANDRPVDAQAVATLVREYRDGVEARLRKAEATRAADLAKSAEQAKRRFAMQIAGGIILAVSIIGIGVSSFFAWRASERAEQEALAKKEAQDKKVEADLATKQAEIDRLEAKKQEAIAKLKAEEADQERTEAKKQEGIAKTNELEAKKQEGIAKQKAEEADKQRNEADKQTGIAKINEAEAKKQLDKSERLVYASKLSLAQSAFAEGNVLLAFHHLEDCQWDLRGWEHRHLWTRFNSKQTLLGHTGGVSSMSWSPDGKRILTGSWDSTAKVWDAEKGQEVLALKGHTDSVTSVSWSPDGKRILTGSNDETAKVWDAEKGTEVLTLKGHTSIVTSVSWSPDGKRIFGWADQDKVLAWDTKTGQPTSADNPPPKPTSSSGSAISPDGRLAAKVDGLKISLIDLLKPPPLDKSNEWPLPDSDERKRYHTEQAKLAEDAKQYFAQAFHLGRLLLDDPENKDLKAKREEALKLHEQANPAPKSKQ